jgi:hypothetical protein
MNVALDAAWTDMAKQQHSDESMSDEGKDGELTSGQIEFEIVAGGKP